MKIRFFALTAIVALVAIVNVSSAQTAEEVFNKHIEALGGESAWENISSIKMTGTLTVNDVAVPFSKVGVNFEGMRVDFKIGGVKNYLIVNQQAGWKLFSADASGEMLDLMTPEDHEKAMVLMSIKHWYLVDRAELNEMELDSVKANIDGKECYKLSMIDSRQQKVTAYVDTKTYYLVRKQVKGGEDGTSAKAITVKYGNYKMQPSGIVLPLSEENSEIGGQIAYKKIEVNSIFEESVFAPDGAGK